MADVKKVPNASTQGLVPGESPFEIPRFGYRKAVNDKREPDRVRSGVLDQAKFVETLLCRQRINCRTRIAILIDRTDAEDDVVFGNRRREPRSIAG